MESQIGSVTSGVYYLKWKGYGVHLTNRISNLLQEEQFADVTIACDGNYIRAHKLLLSLCSPYFKKLFEIHSPDKSNTIVILNHVRFHDLESILSFVYTGSVHVHHSDLNSFLQTGELLQIEGLANSSDSSNEKSTSNTTSTSTQEYKSSEFLPDQSNNILSAQSVSTANISNRSTQSSSSYMCGSTTRITNENPSSSSSSASHKRLKTCSSSAVLSNQNHHSYPNPHFPISAQALSQTKCKPPPVIQQIQVNSRRNSNIALEQHRSASEVVEEDPLADSCNLVTYENYEQKESNGQEKEEEETAVNVGILKTENIVIDVKDSDDENNGRDSHSPSQDEDHQRFLSNLLVETREDQGRVGLDFYTESAAPESLIATTSGSLPTTGSSVFEAPKARTVNRAMDISSSLVDGDKADRDPTANPQRLNSYVLSPEKSDKGYESRNYFKAGDCKLGIECVKIEDLEDESDVELLEPLVSQEITKGTSSLSSCGFVSGGGVKVSRRLNYDHFALQNSHPYAMTVTPVPSRPSNNLAGSLGVGIRMVGPAQVHIEFVRCAVCSEEVAKYALKEHLLKMHCNEKESDMRALCPICGKYFKNKNSLKVHKSMYHRNRGFKPSSLSLSSDESQFPLFNMDHDHHY